MESRQTFSETEKMFLVELVAKYKHILENKRTDGTTLKEKNATWDTVQEIYCSQGFPTKSVKQLKKCWDNIKQRKRQINTSVRQSQLLTGGGPPEHIKKDAVTEFADAVIQNIDIELQNQWDSTAEFEKENNEPSSLTQDEATIVEVQSTPTVKPYILKRKHTDDQCMSTPSADAKRRRESCMCKDKVTKLQIQKLEEAIQQQRELHKKRMETADAEAKLAIARLLNAEKELQDRHLH